MGNIDDGQDAQPDPNDELVEGQYPGGYSTKEFGKGELEGQDTAMVESHQVLGAGYVLGDVKK